MTVATDIIIPQTTPLYHTLQQWVTEKRLLFFAGLPGVGKSLLLQQAALMAYQAGRTVHLLQWDVARAAFETPPLLARYPEVAGVTHPAIRQAVGRWARRAVQQWHERHPAAEHLLIGELPLLGNRLLALVEEQPDGAEALLAGPSAHFVIPVPTQAVRQVIETARARTIAAPQHHKERADAPPNVLQLLWHDLYRLAGELDLIPGDVAQTSSAALPAYDPQIYGAVYQHLLHARPTSVLSIATVLPKVGSVYALPIPVNEIVATLAEVDAIIN
ncbi:MAG: hypothetical protein R3C14_47280 [Caldilineaceae bacterium]